MYVLVTSLGTCVVCLVDDVVGDLHLHCRSKELPICNVCCCVPHLDDMKLTLGGNRHPNDRFLVVG